VSVPVLTAVTGASWEAELVAGLERAPAGLQVVRRCVDVADLLAAASSGIARAALVSGELRRLDTDALSRLRACGVAAVGLVGAGDEASERRLRQLGVDHVLPADSAPAVLAAMVSRAIVERPAASPAHYSVPGSAPHPGSPGANGVRSRSAAEQAGAGIPDSSPGRLVAVWGPTGAPGRTTVAIQLAAELARTGTATLLADADVYGGVVAQVLGLLDEAPGLAAAARLANNGQLDLEALARAAPYVGPDLRVLTGISRAARWPELRPSALGQVWSLCRRLAAWTVVDCAFAIEQDEELSFDTAAPRRNGATIETLQDADVVLAVGTADPVGVQRLVRGLSDLEEVAPGVRPRVVLNRVRRAVVGAHPRTQLAAALEQHAGVADVAFVPDDPASLDAALLHGQLLADVAPDSPARAAFAALAAELAGDDTVRTRRRRRWARAGHR
jgi:Flp pilus assembly CpaE family ATPase